MPGKAGEPWLNDFLASSLRGKTICGERDKHDDKVDEVEEKRKIMTRAMLKLPLLQGLAWAAYSILLS